MAVLPRPRFCDSNPRQISAARLWDFRQGFIAARKPRRCIAVSSQAEGPGAVHNAELKLVQVIFRHGARTPLTPEKPFWEGACWLDGERDCGQLYSPVSISLRDPDCHEAPFSDHNQSQVNTLLPGGCHKGQLTLLGQQQARALGSWLRQRYVEHLHFLDPELQHAGVLSARTTHFQRTIATLQGVLTGLYPNAAEAGIAIPAVTAGDGNEIMYGNANACAKLGQLNSSRLKMLKEQLAADQEVQALSEQVRALMDLQAGKDIPFVELLDAITSLRAHSKATPCAFDVGLTAAIESEATKRMAWAVAPEGEGAREVLRLGLGHLVDEMVGQLRHAQAGGEGPRMRLFSGHDTTVMPMLRMLQQRFSTWPGYTANVVLELWQGAQGTWTVRALYNGCTMDCHSDSDGGMQLEQFLEQYMLPYQLPMEDHDACCRVQESEAEPSQTAQSASGSSVQGI